MRKKNFFYGKYISIILLLNICIFSDVSSRTLLNYMALDAESLALAGSGVAMATSRTSALYTNPALLTDFSKLGVESNFGFLYQKLQLNLFNWEEKIEPEFFFTGSAAVQYEIIENLHFGFLFGVPTHFEMQFSNQQIINNLKKVLDNHIQELIEFTIDKLKSNKESIPVDGKTSSNNMINQFITLLDNPDVLQQIMPLIKSVRGMVEDNLYKNPMDIHLFWTTYEMTPSIAYRYKFFKIGWALNFHVYQFRGFFKSFSKQNLFSLGTKLGFAFDFPYVNIGVMLGLPLYIPKYHAFRFDFPKSYSKIIDMALNLFKLTTVSPIKQVEIQSIASNGLQFVLGLGFNVLPDLMRLFFDYRLTYQGEDPRKNFNLHIFPFLYGLINKKKVEMSDKLMHNIALGLELDSSRFPVAFRMGYNYLHQDKDASNFMPNHLISFGFGIKLWKRYFIDLGTVIGLPRTQVLFKDFNMHLSMEFYKIMIGFKMNVL